MKGFNTLIEFAQNGQKMKTLPEIYETVDEEEEITESPRVQIERTAPANIVVPEYEVQQTIFYPKRLRAKPKNNRKEATYYSDWISKRKNVFKNNVDEWTNLINTPTRKLVEENSPKGSVQYLNEIKRNDKQKDHGDKTYDNGSKVLYSSDVLIPGVGAAYELTDGLDSNPVYAAQTLNGKEHPWLPSYDDYMLAQINNVNTADVVPYINKEKKERALKNNKIDSSSWDVAGMYTPSTHQVYAEDADKWFSSNMLHEITHAAEASPQRAVIAKYMFDHPEIFNHVKRDSYWDSANEIYSRLMQVRQEFGLDPTKEITEEEIEQMIRQTQEGKKKGHNLIDRYDKNTINFLLNKVAQNNPTKNDQLGVSFAQKGAKLSNLKMGKEQDKKQTSKKGLNQRIYNYVDPTQAYPENLRDASKLLTGSLLYGDQQTYEVEDSVADAAWRKRLGLGYDSKFLPENGDGSVRLPKHIEAEIPTDTNMVKRRIADNEKLLEYYNTKRPDVITNKDIIGQVLELDKQTLDSLRHTYKTGEPVVINENAHNNRKLMKNGSLELGLTPLNVLGNFTIRWNPETQQMEYFDKYDFNQFEWGVPGKPFEIKGTITPKPALKSKKK